ncbi:thioredoxin family protein [Nanoarchaeota archaeon]
MTLLKSTQQLKPGDSAPDFNLKGTDEAMHTLKDLKGKKATLIIFMCNHCPYVITKFAVIKDLADKFKDKGVNLIAINPNDNPNYQDDSFENMQKIAEQEGFDFPYLIDSTQEVAKAYDAVCTPDPYLFDKDLKLIWHGRLNDAMSPDDNANENTMEEVINEFLESGKVSKEFLPSQGCSIKWR